MAKRVYKVETPHGTFTRTTDREYTHVVVFTAKENDGSLVVVYTSWAGSKILAEKARPNYYGTCTRNIFPVV